MASLKLPARNCWQGSWGNGRLSSVSRKSGELAERLGVGTPVFGIEENKEKQVLAVVPGRQEIPERLQIGVEDVLRLASGRERWMV